MTNIFYQSKGVLVLLILSLLTLMSGCDGNSVFEGKKDFSNRFWAFNDPAEFEFEIEDIDKTYNLLFSVRNTSMYPFQNIYLQYYLEDSIGRLQSKELTNVQLFNAKTGIPLGSGLGDLYDIEKPFLEKYKFESVGKYKLRIDQFMRKDSLPEIVSVGIRVETAK